MYEGQKRKSDGSEENVAGILLDHGYQTDGLCKKEQTDKIHHDLAWYTAEKAWAGS